MQPPLLIGIKCNIHIANEILCAELIKHYYKQKRKLHNLKNRWKILLVARVQPQWIQGDSKVGTESASLEKYIFNHRYIERLETDSVVGRLVEKRGWITWITWNSIHAPDGNSARKTRSKKEWHGGISLSENWSDFFILGFVYIPFVTYRDEYRVMWGSAVLTFIKIRCFT